MKKTAKLLALAAVLFAGFGSTNAMAEEGFSIGADVVSSYVWRGTDLGNSAAIQPAISYTFDMGLSIGAWGSYAISEDNDGFRYKEIDLTVSMPVGPGSIAVTNYNADPENGRAFDFRDDGANTVEVSGTLSYGGIDFLAGVFVAGNDYDNAWYCEASIPFYEKDGYSASVFGGLGSEDYYGDGEGDSIAIVNTGISVSKDRYTASCIYNPDQENTYLVFMASF